MFLGGQAASLVTASAALNKSDHAEYQASVQQRIATAKKILTAVAVIVPEAKAMLNSPSHQQALAFEAAIKNKNLYTAVQSFMPKKADYK